MTSLVASEALAEEQPLCDALVWEDCADDVISVVSAAGESEIAVALDDKIEVQTTIDVRSSGIQGWSYGVFSDPQYFSVLSTTSNTADMLVQDASFNFDQPAVSSNDGFLQAIVLAFTDIVELPIGAKELVMLEATHEVIALPPADGSVLQYMDGLQGSGQPVDIVLTINGLSALPRKVRTLTVTP